MLPEKYTRQSLGGHFTDDFNEPLARHIFFKALVGYTLLKMILVWPLSRVVMAHHGMSLPNSLPGKLLMVGSFLANHHVNIFFGAGILLLVVLLILKPSYWGNILFFGVTFNLYAINLPIGDGADIVLFMLSFWCVPMATVPRVESVKGAILQQTVCNMALLLCQFQIAYIYLISGLDKLMTGMWRSGEAFDYIRHLEALYNPVLPAIFENEFWDALFSWSVILFELFFAGLVWWKRTRPAILITGIIFHLLIGFVMTLPDFAIVMMVSYLIFVKDAEYARLAQWFRRWLPSR